MRAAENRVTEGKIKREADGWEMMRGLRARDRADRQTDRLRNN